MLSYEETPPPAALRPFLECLWSVRGEDKAREPQRIVPDGCPELILHLGDPFERWTGGRWRRQPRAFLAGTLSRPWLLRPAGRVDTLGVRFHPGALTRLFPVSMEGMADREVPLPEFGARPPRPASPASVAAWLEGLPRPRRAADARAAVALIRRARGGSRIDDVARELGLSRRRLERLFARDLGIPPKLYARIVRLQSVLARRDQAQGAALVDLALDAGYFDEPHLLRDARALAGRSPAAARARDGALAAHFTSPGRLRMLLRGDDAFVQSFLPGAG